MRRTSLRRISAAAGAALFPALLLAAPDATAINQGPSGPETLPAVDTPMWQTNGAVRATVVSKGVLYIGGEFTSIRPPNAAPGTGEVPMSRIAAFHAEGDLAGQPCAAATPCPGIGVWSTQSIDKAVFALSATPLGDTLYAGGDFGIVRGTARGKAAAFDISFPAIGPANRLTSWNPGINGGVRSIASTDSTVYLGGTFTAAAGQARTQTAAYSRATGALTSWAPTIVKLPNATPRVSALLLSPNTGHIVIGGKFAKVNGADRHLVAQVDGGNGKTNGPMSSTIIPVRSGGPAEVKALAKDTSRIYVGVEGIASFDGTAAIDAFSGQRIWITDCHGATQALAVIGEVLYVGSHAHDCTTPPIQGGGFAQSPFQSGGASWYHLMAERTTGTNGPAGSLLAWFPRPDPGVSGKPDILGPRAMATAGSTLFVGGQSLTMNGRRQQGIAMFQSGGPGAAPSAPAVSVTTVNGTATVRWTRSSDMDDSVLTYEVLKNGSVVNTQVSRHPWWQQASFVWRDTGTPADSYIVRVTDGSGLTAQRSATPRAGGYNAAVEANNPTIHWRLDEASGTTAGDSTGGPAGTYRGYVPTGPSDRGALGTAYAVGSGTGLTTNIAANNAASAAPANFSLEMWFNSKSSNGGRLIGFSNAGTTSTASPNRSLYMTNGGQLIYAIRNNDNSTCQTGSDKFWVTGQCYLWSKQSYNDGTWHHVVVTQSSSAGIALYVDGLKVGSNAQGKVAKPATGVWRVGGDNLSGLPRSPAFSNLPASVDEVAVYPTALTAAQVTAHYAAAE